MGELIFNWLYCYLGRTLPRHDRKHKDKGIRGGTRIQPRAEYSWYNARLSQERRERENEGGRKCHGQAFIPNLKKVGENGYVAKDPEAFKKVWEEQKEELQRKGFSVHRDKETKEWRIRKDVPKKERSMRATTGVER